VKALLLCLLLGGAWLVAAPSGASTPPRVYVEDALGQRHQHPARFDFSVNGDLTARELRWKGWRTSTAKARGVFVFSPRPAGSPGVGLTGSLRLTSIVRCGDRRYYSKARLTLDHPGDAPFRPVITIKPC